MELIARVSFIAAASILMGLCLPPQSESVCTPSDASWQQYIPTIAPVVFEGTSTLGGCSGTTCIGPAFPGASRLGDGDHGTAAFNLNAVHAWDRTVSIEFRFTDDVVVGGINLYFYNIPSRNIGLPDDTVLSSFPSFIEGNQDLSQNDNQLRNVTLVPTSTLSAATFTIQFRFSNIDKIDWLLLTEVEICTSATIAPTPLPISFTGDTVSNISPTNINSTISLSCSVVNEGRFTWSWTLPSGVIQSPTFILDAGRTSIIEFSQITSDNSGIHQCHVDYSGLANDPGLSTELNTTLTLAGILQEENPVVTITADDVSATLRCYLYGYLPPGEPSISWFLNLSDNMLTNDATYTITNEVGDRFIQNGGSQTRPSLISALSINLANSPVSSSPSYFCQSNQVPPPGVRQIMITIGEVITTTIGTSSDTTSPGTGTSNTTSDPLPDNLPVIAGAVVGGVVVLIIVVVIILVIVFILKKKGKYKPGSYMEDYDTKEPFYQEVSKPLPPPLPTRFPSLPPSDIGPYAVVENGAIGGQMELVNMNGNRYSVSSIPDPNNPTPLRLKNQPNFLQNNPLYASADHIDQSSDVPQLPFRRMLGSVGSMDEVSNSTSTHGSILNIYALPSKVAPPIPERPPTPQLFDGPVYSEALSPTMLSEKRFSSPPASSEDLCPYSSVYADPKPLLKSEGPKEVEPHQVREIRSLGVGQFGQVVLAETVGLSLKELKLSDSNDDKNITVLVAIKKLKPDADLATKEAFEKEIKFMSRLNDNNVVRLLGICSYGNAFIIMEYMENGDLNQYLHKHADDASNGGTRLSPSVLLYMSMQISSGMMYLATLKFIHRDLATRNCLVGSSHEVKIADFGMSRSLYTSYYYRIRGRAMLPIRWMANECFYGRFTEKTDVWAFGVTMWEVFTFGMKQPYDEMTDQEVIDDAIKGADRQLLERPKDCPPKVYQVMLRCWVDDPDKRAKFEEIHTSLATLYENNDLS